MPFATSFPVYCSSYRQPNIPARSPLLQLTQSLSMPEIRVRSVSLNDSAERSPMQQQTQTKTEQSPRRDLNTNKCYKQRNSLGVRRQEVINIQNKFPGKVPVIVERFKKERDLPPLDKTKFLVPQDITMSQFVTVIRNRMCVRGQQAIYFLINQRAVASMSVTMAELYDQHRDKDDGFLYMTYASQEMFG